MNLTPKNLEREHGPFEQRVLSSKFGSPETHNLVLHRLFLRIYHQQHVTFCCQNSQTYECDICQCELHEPKSPDALHLSESQRITLHPFRLKAPEVSGRRQKCNPNPPQLLCHHSSPLPVYSEIPMGHILEQTLALF